MSIIDLYFVIGFAFFVLHLFTFCLGYALGKERGRAPERSE